MSVYRTIGPLVYCSSVYIVSVSKMHVCIGYEGGTLVLIASITNTNKFISLCPLQLHGIMRNKRYIIMIESWSLLTVRFGTEIFRATSWSQSRTRVSNDQKLKQSEPKSSPRKQNH